MKITIEEKKRMGRPFCDPFRPQLKQQGAAHTYTKNIPAKDWAKFKEFLGETPTRHAIIRFIQELPNNPSWLRRLA